jgi:hypothetical protein
MKQINKVMMGKKHKDERQKQRQIKTEKKAKEYNKETNNKGHKALRSGC